MENLEFWENVFSEYRAYTEPCLPGLDVDTALFEIADIAEVYHQLTGHEYNVLVVKLVDGRFVAIKYTRAYTSGCWARLETKFGLSLEQIERFGLTPYDRQYFKIVLPNKI